MQSLISSHSVLVDTYYTHCPMKSSLTNPPPIIIIMSMPVHTGHFDHSCSSVRSGGLWHASNQPPLFLHGSLLSRLPPLCGLHPFWSCPGVWTVCVVGEGVGLRLGWVGGWDVWCVCVCTSVCVYFSQPLDCLALSSVSSPGCLESLMFSKRLSAPASCRVQWTVTHSLLGS